MNENTDWYALKDKRSDFEKWQFAEAYIKQLQIDIKKQNVTIGGLNSEIQHLEQGLIGDSIKELSGKLKMKKKECQMLQNKCKLHKEEINELRYKVANPK